MLPVWQMAERSAQASFKEDFEHRPNPECRALCGRRAIKQQQNMSAPALLKARNSATTADKSYFESDKQEH